MIQPQWPGLGPTSQPPYWGNAAPGGGAIGGPSQPADGIGTNWWEQGQATAFRSSFGGTSQSSLVGMLQSLIGLLGQLVGSMFGAGGTPATGGGATSGDGAYAGSNGYGGSKGYAGYAGPGGYTGYAGPSGYGGYGYGGSGGAAPSQPFADVTLASTGDPHLSETGTRLSPGGPQAVSEHFDSMSSHSDLIDAHGLAGGYRVSTTVTPPNAQGVTSNQSATVHANCGRDAVTMNRDGSYSVTSNGQAVALTPGQSLTLGGGENVTFNADGSLVVSAADGNGGSISTTLRSTGSGVDVTAQAHGIRVGGDIVEHDAGSATGSTPSPRRLPVRDTGFAGAA